MTDAHAELRPFNVQQLFQRWTDELTRVDQEPNVALIAAIESIAERDGWSLTEYAQARMVPASKRDGLTAASRGFNPDMHPRGKDGKFIVKFGFVNVLLNALQQDESSKTKFSPTGAKKNQRGRVVDIIPDPKNPGDPDIRVEIMDSNGKQLGFATVKSDSITAAEPIKARLDLDEPVLPDESMPDMPEDVMPAGMPPEVALPGNEDTVSTPIDEPSSLVDDLGEAYAMLERNAPDFNDDLFKQVQGYVENDDREGLKGLLDEVLSGDDSEATGKVANRLDLLEEMQKTLKSPDAPDTPAAPEASTSKTPNKFDPKGDHVEQFRYGNPGSPDKGLDDFGKGAAKLLTDDELDEVIAIRETQVAKSEGLSPKADLEVLQAEKARRSVPAAPAAPASSPVEVDRTESDTFDFTAPDRDVLREWMLKNYDPDPTSVDDLINDYAEDTPDGKVRLADMDVVDPDAFDLGEQDTLDGMDKGLQWDEASYLWRFPDGTEASFDDVENAGYDGTLRSGPPDDAPRYNPPEAAPKLITGPDANETADLARKWGDSGNDTEPASMSTISDEQIESQTRIDLQYRAQNEAANVEGEYDQSEERDAFVDALWSIDSATVGGRANEVWDALDDAREKRDFFVDSLENEDDAQMITDDFAWLDEMAIGIERDYGSRDVDYDARNDESLASEFETPAPAAEPAALREDLTDSYGWETTDGVREFVNADGELYGQVDQNDDGTWSAIVMNDPGREFETRFNSEDDAQGYIERSFDEERGVGKSTPSPVTDADSQVPEWDGGDEVLWNPDTNKFVNRAGVELSADEVESYGLDPGGRFGKPSGMKDLTRERDTFGGQSDPTQLRDGGLTQDQINEANARIRTEESAARISRMSDAEIEDEIASIQNDPKWISGEDEDYVAQQEMRLDALGSEQNRRDKEASIAKKEAAGETLNIGEQNFAAGRETGSDNVAEMRDAAAAKIDADEAEAFTPRDWAKTWKSAGELDEYLAGLTPEQKMADIDNAAKDPRSMKVLPARLKKMKDDDLWAMFDTVDGADFGSTDGDSDGLREVKIEMARRKLVRFKGKGPKATKDAASVPSSGGPADKSWIPTAKSGDKVPISELPVGAEVIMGGQWRKVGAPILLDGGDPKNPDDYRFKYWDGVQWDWVQPDTQFTVGSMPAGKKLHSMGRKYHEAAAAAGGAGSPKAPAAPKAAPEPSFSSGKFAQSSQAARNAYEAVLAGKIKPQMVMNTGTPAKGKVVAQGKGASYTFVKAPSTGEWYLTYGDSFGGVSGVPAGPGDMNTPSGIKVTDLEVIDALDAVAVL